MPLKIVSNQIFMVIDNFGCLKYFHSIFVAAKLLLTLRLDYTFNRTLLLCNQMGFL